MAEDPLDDDDDAGAAPLGGGDDFVVAFGPEQEGARLDAALAAAAPARLALSRSRLRKLIEDGRVAPVDPGAAQRLGPSDKVKAGLTVVVRPPPPEPIAPSPEALPISILFEDAHLIVVDKPAGMAVHPAPGTPSGTLVNALLHHCGDSLSGVGGARRPGVVHRIDKDTSGLLVVAKTDAAHQGLAAQFADKSAERVYVGVAWGALDRADPQLRGLPGVSFDGAALRIDADLARSPADRKRMAVAPRGPRGAPRPGAKSAVTRAWPVATFGRDRQGRAVVSRIACRLETGRTHQIRAHLAHVGRSLVGDPVYGRPRSLPAGALPEAAARALAAFPRQALHAARLGFHHPVNRTHHIFDAELPHDIDALLTALAPARA